MPLAANGSYRETIIRNISNSSQSGFSVDPSDVHAKVKQYRWYKRLFTRKSSRRRFIKISLVAANVALLAVVAGFVLQKPETTGTTVSDAILATQEESIANPLDALSSADIALSVARITKIPEQVQVANHADTVNAQLTVTPADDVVVAQPQIISTGLKSRADIESYKVKEGDSVASVAKKFNITSDTIRWSNAISGDSLQVGQTIIISPVSGIVYTVKSGDTIDNLVVKYRVDRAQFIAFNDLESGNLPVGERIVLPDGQQPVTRRAPSTTSYSYAYSNAGFEAIYGYNGYTYGYCTWHVANRRAAAGRGLPSNLGNAISWYYRARSGGLSVGSTPRAGAVLWHANLGGLGHVGYVESVNGDGSVNVSDMNYPYWGRISYRTISKAELGAYQFIY